MDRLVRGRAWIPVLGVLLAGIVAMQVEVLKLGTGMGRWIERSSALQSRNELLRASVASLADDQRIERLAAGMGMVMPAPTGLNFLAVRAGQDAATGVSRIHPPDPAQFIAALPAAATQDPTAIGLASTGTTPSPTSQSAPSAAPSAPATSTATAGAPPSTATAQPAAPAGGGASAPSGGPATSSTQGSGGASPSSGGASPSIGG